MTLEKIVKKMKGELATPLKDLAKVATVLGGFPHIYATTHRLVNEAKSKPEINSWGVTPGLALGVSTLIASAVTYTHAVKSGHAEFLALPVATNLASALYERNRDNIKQYFMSRKEKRVQSAVSEAKNVEVDEKLTLKDRILGKKKTTIILNPQITMTPSITVYVNDEKQNDVRVEVKDASAANEIKTDPLDPYKISAEPFYLSNNGELNLFETAFKNKLPVMLKGPTGCGKTRFVEHMAYRLGRPLITVNCQEDLSASDLVGRILLNGQGTYWQDGPLTKAARHGGICYLDEVVEARNDAMVLIHSLTDHRRILPIDKTGEVIDAHPDFMLVISYNPNYQSALKNLKQSTRQRFVAMDFGYPSKTHEISVVQKESGVSPQIADKLVQFGAHLRGMKGQGLDEGASTRLLAYAGKLINTGMTPYNAVDSAIISPITDEPDIQTTMRDVAKTMF